MLMIILSLPCISTWLINTWCCSPDTFNRVDYIGAVIQRIPSGFINNEFRHDFQYGLQIKVEILLPSIWRIFYTILLLLFLLYLVVFQIFYSLLCYTLLHIISIYLKFPMKIVSSLLHTTSKGQVDERMLLIFDDSTKSGTTCKFTFNYS